ncbi:MAG: DUF1697 domain-containing protein [Acidimicrobiales bacterium]
MPTWIGLLRAVNLGSHNKVPMPALRKAMEAAGFADVRTYVQSGNVVATSARLTRDEVAERIRPCQGGIRCGLSRGRPHPEPARLGGEGQSLPRGGK